MDLVTSLFDLSNVHEKHRKFLEGRQPWQWLADLMEHLKTFPNRPREDALRHGGECDDSEGPVYIEEGVRLQVGSLVKGPAYISRNTVVAYGAIVRDGCLIMPDSRIGKGCEVRGSIILSNATCKRQNYVGDSVIGNRVRLFTGAKVSNEPLRRHGDPQIMIRWETETIATGLHKLGTLIGDGTTIGCGVTLNHGSVIGRDCAIDHNLVISGAVPHECDVKNAAVHTVFRKRSG